MKKFVKLLPALVMLLISAILVSTTTYAWFSMNSQVTAKNMKVKAIAEQGIVISDSLKSAWSNVADARYNKGTSGQVPVELLPTSMKETETPGVSGAYWVHATSPQYNDANASLTIDGNGTAVQNYKELTTLAWSETDEGIGYVDKDASNSLTAGDEQYVRKDVFFIRAASTDMLATAGTNLYIKSVTTTATPNATAGQDPSTNLDKAVRVLVVITESDGSTKHAFLFAPISGFSSTYYYNEELDPNANPAQTHTAGATVTPIDASGADPYLDVNGNSANITIPNAVNSALKVEVYTFFEGEDANLMSANAANTIAMDTLDTTIVFTTEAPVVTP